MAWPMRLLTCLGRIVSDLIRSCYKITIAVDTATLLTISLQIHMRGAQHFNVTIIFEQWLAIKNAC